MQPSAAPSQPTQGGGDRKHSKHYNALRENPKILIEGAPNTEGKKGPEVNRTVGARDTCSDGPSVRYLYCEQYFHTYSGYSFEQESPTPRVASPIHKGDALSMQVFRDHLSFKAEAPTD